MANVSKEIDDFLDDKITMGAVWIAEMSDGSQIFDDDGRLGEIKTAWSRLKEFIEEERAIGKPTNIVNVKARFRSYHLAPLPANAEGYLVGRGVGIEWGSPTNHHYLILGYVEDGKLKTMKYKVPEMILVESDIRDIEDYKDSIIWNC